MRLSTLLFVLGHAALTLPGCEQPATESGSTENSSEHSEPKKDTHVSILSEMTELMNEVHAIVIPVNDQTSAEAAAKKLEPFFPTAKSITDRLEALEEPPEDERERLGELTRDELTELKRKIEEVQKVGSKYRELKKAITDAIPVF